MHVLSENHFKMHPGTNVPFDPVLIKKSQLELVTKLDGSPTGSWGIRYGVRRHRFDPTPADRENGMPDRADEQLLLRITPDGAVGTQGTALIFKTDEDAQRFLGALEDYKAPAKADTPKPDGK